MYIKYHYLLTRVGRDGNVNDGEKYIWLLYGIVEKDVKGIYDARHSLFVKVKHDFEMLPPAHDAFKSNILQGLITKLRYGFKHLESWKYTDWNYRVERRCRWTWSYVRESLSAIPSACFQMQDKLCISEMQCHWLPESCICCLKKILQWSIFTFWFHWHTANYRSVLIQNSWSISIV